MYAYNIVDDAVVVIRCYVIAIVVCVICFISMFVCVHLDGAAHEYPGSTPLPGEGQLESARGVRLDRPRGLQRCTSKGI